MNFPDVFVSATKERTSFEQHVPAPVFRLVFPANSEGVNTKMIVTGLGFYRLWINGKEITKGYLAPYISNPDDIVYFDAYDLTPYIQQGDNVVGLMLGNGFQNNIDTVWDFDEGKHNAAPMMALNLQVGKQMYTAEDFVWAPSEVIFDNYRCGVHIDARRKIDGWMNVDFDDSDWRTPISVMSPRGEKRFCEAEPIVKLREIEPVSIRKSNLLSSPARADVIEETSEKDIIPVPIAHDDGYLFDFGVNTAGIFRFKIKGDPGQRVVFQMSERLTEGNADPTNISFFYPEGYGQRDVYICRGDEEGESFVPPFTYHGFRYIYVSGLKEEQIEDIELVLIELSSNIEQRSTFKCSDDVSNQLWTIALRSDRANFYYFPTDCPHREKNGWTGDAAVSAEHMAMVFNVEKSFREWTRNICKAQNMEGALPGIVPTTGWGFEWGNGPAWDQVLFEIPYINYKYYGDTQIIRESAPSMLRYLDYLSVKRNKYGLVELGLGDWCPVGRAPDDYVPPLGLTDSILSYSMCKKAELLFTVIDLKQQASFASSLGKELWKAIRSRYLDANTMMLEGHCQTSQAMGIYYDIFTSGEKHIAYQNLIDIIKADGNKMNFGFLGGRVVFHVLSIFGNSELAYEMITRNEYPSYHDILNRGATSLWEMFLPEPHRSGSENHHFWGDISHWYLKHLAGLNVNPKIENPNTILFQPRFIKQLDWVEGSLKLPVGQVSSSWHRDDDTIIFDLEIPSDVEAYLRLENGWKIKNDGYRTYCDLVPGKHQLILFK